MSIKRLVSVDFWTDSKVVDLFSPEDKYFMLYLLTNPHSSPLGIYQISPKMAAFELGYSVEAVKVLLERFTNKYGIIQWDNDTQEVAIKNYLVHSVVTGGKPVTDMLCKELQKVKNKKLILWVFDHIKSKDGLGITVKAIIDNYISNIDRDRDRESYHDSSHDSSKVAPRAKKKQNFTPPTLEEVKAYVELRHNGVDAQRFYDYYTAGNWHNSQGKQVLSWKQTMISNWEGRNNNSQPAQPRPQYESIDMSQYDMEATLREAESQRRMDALLMEDNDVQ